MKRLSQLRRLAGVVVDRAGGRAITKAMLVASARDGATIRRSGHDRGLTGEPTGTDPYTGLRNFGLARVSVLVMPKTLALLCACAALPFAAPAVALAADNPLPPTVSTDAPAAVTLSGGDAEGQRRSQRGRDDLPLRVRNVRQLWAGDLRQERRRWRLGSQRRSSRQRADERHDLPPADRRDQRRGRVAQYRSRVQDARRRARARRQLGIDA